MHRSIAMIHEKEKLLSIGLAAKFLRVSIDTLRRWDKRGIIKSVRPNGKNRLYPLQELVNFKLNRPLTLSEAALRLGISTITLRRMETRGLISPVRNANNERLYPPSVIEALSNKKIERVKEKIKIVKRKPSVSPSPRIPRPKKKNIQFKPVLQNLN